MNSKSLLIILLLLTSLADFSSSEGVLDTLKKGVNAVKKFVDKIFPESRDKICKEPDNKLFEKISNLICLESYARKLGHLPMYVDCWDRYNKIPHPVTHDQWTEFYCKNDHYQMYKNIADHCFIRNLALNGTILIEGDMGLKECSNKMIPIVYDAMGIKRQAHANQTLQDTKSGDAKPSAKLIDCSATSNSKLLYCRKKYEKVANLCTKPDKKKIDKDVMAWTCYETTLINSPKGMESLKECWNLTTGTAYPASPDEFAKFTCSFDYPHAYRPLIKECMEELNQIPYKDMKEVKKNCRKDFYSLTDIIVSQELKRAFRHQISARAREKMCTTLSPEKYTASKSTSKLQCYAIAVGKERESCALNYCFSIGSLEGRDLPSDNRQWFDYTCPKNNSSFLNAVSQDKTIQDCFDELMHESKMKIPDC